LQRGGGGKASTQQQQQQQQQQQHLRLIEQAAAAAAAAAVARMCVGAHALVLQQSALYMGSISGNPIHVDTVLIVILCYCCLHVTVL
jgi:hypothetical protein